MPDVKAPLRRIRGRANRLGRRVAELREPVVLPSRPPMPDTPVRLLVGPANFAGQGWAWARAAEDAAPGVTAQAFAVLNDRIDFDADYAVPRETFLSPRWQRQQRTYVTRAYTHVLIEAARPVLGARDPWGDRCTGDLPILRSAGLRVAMVSHGSDVRVPSDHIDRYPWSPFTDLPAARLRSLQINSTANRDLMRAHDGPVYVSTPDLLDDLPDAAWLPVIVDVGRWATGLPVMARDRPVVAHAPSNSPMKGSDLVDPVVRALADRGVVEYRRVEGVSPADMPAVYQDADVVLDQFRLGSYGVAACEAMAAGRVVVGHVTEEVRARVREYTGRELPIVESTPETLEQVLRALVADRDAAAKHAAAGADFAAEIHDGRRSASVLAAFVGTVPEPAGSAPRRA
ncbi:glycosyltransferase family protein [Jiangella alkaliphila]|uniref:Uncharacterized protein n=1 Tax=Jiangella alkaliphila TaxID=419479 RepID=A0A1H2M0F2_9ACTN|nr:hypothetical protein [Jiangella alkaliphila]SDU86717.1 hypothetical protein SAMN04488563_6917 [Jiangella alkaliphila]